MWHQDLILLDPVQQGADLPCPLSPVPLSSFCSFLPLPLFSPFLPTCCPSRGKEFARLGMAGLD